MSKKFDHWCCRFSILNFDGFDPFSLPKMEFSSTGKIRYFDERAFIEFKRPYRNVAILVRTTLNGMAVFQICKDQVSNKKPFRNNQ